MHIQKQAGVKLSALAIAAGLLATAPTAALAADKFIFAHSANPEHIMNRAADKFVEAVRADGRLELEYQPGGTLGDWTSLFEQTVRGVTPMTLTFGVADIDARFDVGFLAYIVDSWDSAKELYGPGGKMIDFYQVVAADHDLVVLGTSPVDFAGIAMRKGQNKTPVSFPEDGAGIQMRVPGIPVAVERFKAWGFNPVPMPYSELYTALQLGTVDGRAFGTPPEIWEMRDVLENFIFTRDYFEHAFWFANKTWWNGLTEEERASIRSAVNIANEWAWERAEAESADLLKNITDEGIKVVELTPKQLEAAKELVYKNEWPFMEEKLGADTMNMLREIAGITQ